MEYDPQQDICEIDWASFSTAYGAADKVPHWLQLLTCPEREVALNASHKLWCSLCHQHAYVSSAALPSYPILLKILQNSSDELSVETLDILLGFAHCSAKGFVRPSSPKPEWVFTLYERMRADMDRFRELANSQNEDIRDFATCIVEALEKEL